MIAARTRRYTGRCVIPAPAATAMDAASTREPDVRRREPASYSSPLRQQFSPERTPRKIRTRSSPLSVSSCRITPLAPSGSIAPVISRTACPRLSGTVATSPAYNRSTTCSSTGASGDASRVSSAQTAYPSSGERSKGGCASGANTSRAITLPSAPSRGTSSAGLTTAYRRAIAMASSIVMDI